MPVHRCFYADIIQFPVDGKILENTGASIGAGDTDHTFYGTAFHSFYGNAFKAAFHLVKNTHAMGPGIAFILYHHRHGRRTAEIFGTVIFLVKGRNIACFFIKGDFKPSVFRRIPAAFHIREGPGRLPYHQTVGAVAKGRELGDKHKPRPSVAGGQRLYGLQRYLRALLIHQNLIFLQAGGFHFHLEFTGKGVGIEYHDGLHILFHGDINMPGYGLHCRIQPSRRRIQRSAIAFPGILIGRFYGGSRHDVMELVKQHLFPAFRILFQRIFSACPVLSCNRKLFRHNKAVFRQTVQLLHLGMGAVTAAGMVEQLAGYHRQRPSALLNRLKIVIRRG